MNARFGPGSLLCVCLLLSTACSPGEDREDAGTGGPSDAGQQQQQDAGGDPPDAGDDPDDHTVGAGCTAEVTAQQGDCDDGLICVLHQAFPGGLCTKQCVGDEDCGSHEGQPNKCVPIGNEKVCMRGCDPIVTNSCGRGNHACNEEEDGSGVCVTRCDALPGSCPQGLTCDTTTGICKARETYETCGQTIGACDLDHICVVIGDATEGICLKDCTADDSICGAHGACALNVGQDKVCVQTCGGLTSPPCPATANRCGVIAQGLQACVPPGPAGSQEPYQQCGTGFGACVAGADCLVASDNAPSGICVTDCTSNQNACGSGEECVPNGPGSSLCLKPCTGDTPCPTGSTCAQGYCGPS